LVGVYEIVFAFFVERGGYLQPFRRLLSIALEVLGALVLIDIEDRKIEEQDEILGREEYGFFDFVSSDRG
jgi:hypothetical protein